MDIKEQTRACNRTGRPPKKQAEALGDHVLAIADALFIESGYNATSMATVASRAKVGKQTLYRRFPDKAALFREVIRRRIDALTTALADGVAGDGPAGELKKMGGAALNAVLDPELIRLFRIIIAEALPFPELARSALDHWDSGFNDRCTEIIQRAQAKGMCKPGDPEKFARFFLWSLIGEAFLRELSGQECFTCESDRQAHLEFAWRVFLGGSSMEYAAWD